MSVAPQDHVSSFIDVMSSHGSVIDEPFKPDGRFHRYHVRGDKPGKRNAWAILHLDERPFGMFGDLKRLGSEKIRWWPEGAKPLTPKEREELRSRARAKKAEQERKQAESYAAAAVRANAIWDAAVPCSEHPYLKRKKVASHDLRTGDWVKEYVHPETGEVTEKRIKNALLIPVRNSRKQIVSLQAIFTSDKNALARDRDFLAGAEKRGMWFAIGKPTEHDGQVTVCIVEGYATGASVHAATGLGVVVAFDAGNLVPVAETVRRLMPKACIVIASDNDAWTSAPMENPGWTYAVRAAAQVDGIVALARFSSTDGRPTDFNDLAGREGSEIVRQQIFAAVGPAPAAAEDAAVEAFGPPIEEGETVLPDQEAPAAEKKKRKTHERAPAGGFDLDGDRDSGAFFKVLGHDEGLIHVYSYEKNMVVSRSDDRWRSSLLAIARLEWWEKEFKGDQVGGQGWEKAACNWLIGLAYRRGYYDPSKVRGRGAWLEDKRIVFHAGNCLFVDGVKTALGRLEGSQFVYTRRPSMAGADFEPLSDDEGRRIFELALAFRWTKPSSGVLLAGWCALAGVAGALRWRPHIWITGGSGSGKSTIIDEFVSALLSECIICNGASTEAGVRQTLQGDAIPVLFEESESQSRREALQIDSVIGMIRNSSTETGAKTLKGTVSGQAQAFDIRSMFCLGSIAVGIQRQADRERISILELMSKSQSGEEATRQWREIGAKLDEVIRAQDDLSDRLMSRALRLLPHTLANIKTFTAAATKKFGTQRHGDQYGTLAAGAWSLFNSGIATEKDAMQMLDAYDWAEQQEHVGSEESHRVLAAILEAMIPMGAATRNVRQLTERAINAPEMQDSKDAHDLLHAFGLRVEGRFPDGTLYVSNTSAELKRLLEPSGHADYARALRRIPGVAIPPGTKRFGSDATRSIGVPLRMIFGEEGALGADDSLEDQPWSNAGERITQ